jgi:hypothetical protein
MQGWWSRDKGLEFVPYANGKGRMKYFPGAGADGVQRYVSELSYGMFDLQIGLVDPRSAHTNPVAQLLGTDELGEAPAEMVEQVMYSIFNTYPTSKRWTDVKEFLYAVGGRQPRLRFRPGLGSKKTPKERRLERLLKARKNLQAVLGKYDGICTGTSTALKSSASLTKHTKGEDLALLEVVPDHLTATAKAMQVLRHEILAVAYAELNQRALTLAKEL